MPERDWERDWEICKKATPGPWRNKVWYCKTRVLNDGKCCFCGNANGVLVHEETDSEGERYHIHEFPDSDWRTIWSVSKFCRVVGTCDYEEGGVCTSEDDALFVAEARTGWPAALRERARLEKRVRELEDVLELATVTLTQCYLFKGYGFGPAVQPSTWRVIQQAKRLLEKKGDNYVEP